MLATTVRLHDIDDIESFVCATIERAGLGGVPECEKEELVADGLRILYDLAARFEPHRPGYEQPGRFNGFAAQFLPRRLGDAWHARHPEHIRVVGEDGKRHWIYRDTPISFDAFLEERPDRQTGDPGQRGGTERAIRPSSQQAQVPILARAVPSAGA